MSEDDAITDGQAKGYHRWAGKGAREGSCAAGMWP